MSCFGCLLQPVKQGSFKQWIRRWKRSDRKYKDEEVQIYQTDQLHIDATHRYFWRYMSGPTVAHGIASTQKYSSVLSHRGTLISRFRIILGGLNGSLWLIWRVLRLQTQQRLWIVQINLIWIGPPQSSSRSCFCSICLKFCCGKSSFLKVVNCWLLYNISVWYAW